MLQQLRSSLVFASPTDASAGMISTEANCRTKYCDTIRRECAQSVSCVLVAPVFMTSSTVLSAFHKTLPLFASAAHDGTIQIFHGRVFDDLMRDPLIVPLRILRTPIHEELGVMDVVFHRTQPWIFAAGADGVIRLFMDV
jgi:hypothetical protein